MSQYRGYKTTLFRADGEGRTVIAAFGDVYRVPDEAAADRVARAYWRSTQVVTLANVVVLFLALALVNPALLLLVPAGIVAQQMFLRRVVTALPRTGLRAADLPALDRRERRAHYFQALGRRAIWRSIVLGLLLSALGIFTAWTARDDIRAGPLVLWAGLGTAILGTATALYFLFGLREVSRAP